MCTRKLNSGGDGGGGGGGGGDESDRNDNYGGGGGADGDGDEEEKKGENKQLGIFSCGFYFVGQKFFKLVAFATPISYSGVCASRTAAVDSFCQFASLPMKTIC